MYKHALQLEPSFPDAHNNLGNALRESGRLEEAIGHYRAALKIKPDHPHAYNNLGNALKDKGMVKEAIHCYMTACRLMPRFAAAHSNLGSILKEQGKLEQAIAHYQEAIAIDPMFADAYSNLGNAHKDVGQLDEAIRCYTTAIRLKPAFADAYSNLASAYKDGARIDDAITCYRKALSLRPYFPDALSNMVHSLVTICDWRKYQDTFDELMGVVEQQLAADEITLPCVQPFHAFIFPFTLELLHAVTKRYARRAQQQVQLLEMPPFRFRAHMPRERLRIGYVSSDFGNHPLSHLTMNFYRLHDRSKYEIFCYALTPDDQSMWRRQIMSSAEHFKDVSLLEHAAAARLIHSDGIHILINLNGYTKGGRSQVFALRPAPIQLSFLGFCGTLGADYMDYMVADVHCVPPQPEFTAHYSEKMVYMPHSYFPNDHKQSARGVLDPDQCFTRDRFGIPEDKFVFCCFNQMYKITPQIFDVWMKILKRVPNSILWLLRFPALGEANIRAEARARGVDQDRIHFTDVSPKDEHLKRSYCADLFLDTTACNAHTTGCDVLWSGTPMITTPGKLMASRVGASLLQACGLPELIAESLEEYEELAVDLALNMDRLWEIRKKLEDARETCALFDTARFVRNLEKGCQEVWGLHERGEPKAHVQVMDNEPLNLKEVKEGEGGEGGEGGGPEPMDTEVKG
jgi:protein O-GlcNAc transferase